MAAEKERAVPGVEELSGGLDDAELGAAGIGDEGVQGSEASNFGKDVKSSADGKRKVDEIGIAKGGVELAEERFVESAAGLGVLNDVGAVPAGDVKAGGVLAESKGEGAANEAGAEDSDAADEVIGHGRKEVYSQPSRVNS
jgi:hypothetical protein